MGTYDTRGGTPRHDPMFDEFPPCEVCGLDPALGCQCPECPICNEVANPNCYGVHIKSKPDNLSWEQYAAALEKSMEHLHSICEEISGVIGCIDEETDFVDIFCVLEWKNSLSRNASRYIEQSEKFYNANNP
jgi:hypothetical protein